MTARTLLLLALSLPLCTALNAQPTAQFIVMNITGTVRYCEKPGAEQCELVPGQTLGPESVVTLPSGSTARLLFEDQSISLKEAGNYPLKSLAASQTPASTSFMKRFFNYVYEGIVNTSGSKKIEEYHELYIPQSSGGIKGFAGGDYGIALTRPVAGNLPEGPVVFEWFTAGDQTLYDFQIIDFQTEGLLFKALLRDTSFSLDLSKLAIEPGRKYYWYVQLKSLGEMALGFPLVDDPSMRSPKVEIVMSGKGNSGLMNPLEASPEYLEAGESDRLLMKAQVFEEAQYIYEANETFLKAIELHPADPVLQRVYGAFLVRQGLWQSSQKYLRS